MKWVPRILSAFGALIALGLLVLLALSRSGDVGKLHSTVEISAPPEKVYPWLEHGGKAKEWVSWVVETKPVGNASNGVGSREVWMIRDPNMSNQLIPVEGTYTEYAPPSRLSMVLASPAFRGTQTYQLKAVAPRRTRLDVDAHYQVDGWFPQLMMPLVMPAAKEKMQNDLTRLKNLVESSATT